MSFLLFAENSNFLISYSKIELLWKGGWGGGVERIVHKYAAGDYAQFNISMFYK